MRFPPRGKELLFRRRVGERHFLQTELDMLGLV